MTRKRTMRVPEASRPRRRPWGQLELGEVVSHQPYTSRMDVRLKGAGGRVVQNVLVSPDQHYSEGDWVLLAKATAERHWMLVVKLPRHDEYGYEASATQGGATELHPPANFTVHSAKQHLVADWDAWPGAAICFQTQVHTASNVDDDVGDLSYTFGNTLLYQGTPGTVYYARVRAVRFDTDAGTAHASAWTSWASGFPLPHYGTEAARVAYGTGSLLYGTLWVESDTTFSYLWNGVGWVPVDWLRIAAGPPDTVTGDFGRLASQAILSVLDDEPSAFRIADDGNLHEDYLTVVTEDVQRKVVINQHGADIDFCTRANGVADALEVRGSDGQITLGILTAGYVKASAAGILSVATEVPLADLADYTQGDLIFGGAADWDELAHPAAPNRVLQSTAAEVGWSANAVTFPAAGAVPVGTGANTQVAYWTGVNAIAGDAQFTYDPATDTLTLAGQIILNPATTASAHILSITPSAAIGTIGSEWDAIGIDGDALDPSVVDVHIHGLHIDFSTVDLTHLPHIDGIHIETPATYHGHGHGIHLDGLGIRIDQDDSSAAPGDTHTIIDVVIDDAGSTGGVTHVLDVAEVGGGSVDVVAVGTHEGVGVIHQYIGNVAVTNKAWRYVAVGPAWTDATAEFGGGVDLEIFAADDDVVYISGSAEAVVFDEIEVILTVASSKSIHPVFEYSKAGPVWTEFHPGDDTDGFQDGGLIRFESGDLTDWARVNVNGEGGGATLRYWIRITRTRNVISTPPTEATIKVRLAMPYYWNELGNLSILGMIAGADIDPSAASGQDLGDATHRWDLYTQDVIFGGASGANVITVPDNLADALQIVDSGGTEYLRLITTNAGPAMEVVWNHGEADVDFRIASGVGPNAFFVRGSDGDVGINTAVPGAKFEVAESGDVHTEFARFLNTDIVSDNLQSWIVLGKEAANFHSATLGYTYDTSEGDEYAFLNLYGESPPTGLVVRKGGYVGVGVVPDRLLHAEVSDVVTNAVTYAQRLSHITSNTAVAGFGTGIEFELEENDGSNRVAAYITVDWQDAGEGASADGRLNFGVMTADAAAATAMSIWNGNVGIGALPETPLHVETAATGTPDVLRLHSVLASSGDGPAIQFRTNVGGDAWTYARIRAIDDSGFGGQLVFETNLGGGVADDVTVEAMRIDEDGNVGIDETAPAGKTHIKVIDAAGIPVLVLEQLDISEGTINFIASDRGVITGATNSLVSVRVEIGGVVHRLALYVDA